MMQSYLERVIFFTLIFISIQGSNQVEFNVESIDSKGSYCIESEGDYNFNILGTFSGSIDFYSLVYFNVTTNGKKHETKCYPSSKSHPQKLECVVKIRYTLNLDKIVLPATAPKSNKLTIKNWEKVIGSSSISGVTCRPREKNIFTPTLITIGDCNDFTRSIKIKGNWIEDRIQFPSSTSTTISFDFPDGDLIKCNYNESNSEFDCEFPRKGGNVDIRSQFIPGGQLGPFKINKYDSNEYAQNCDNDDYDDEIIKVFEFANSLHFLNKILILVSLLLF